MHSHLIGIKREVLSSEQVASARELLSKADWVDGVVTAGRQSARAKRNMQAPEDQPIARQLGDMILNALQENLLFAAAALPLRVFPPLFNRYERPSLGAATDRRLSQPAAPLGGLMRPL